MANTYELIASSTVGAGGASSIDFNSIPNTYTDLLVKLSGRSSTGYNALTIIFLIIVEDISFPNGSNIDLIKHNEYNSILIRNNEVIKDIDEIHDGIYNIKINGKINFIDWV